MRTMRKVRIQERDLGAYKRTNVKGKKEKVVYFCSYSCTRAWDKEHEKAKGGKKT